MPQDTDPQVYLKEISNLDRVLDRFLAHGQTTTSSRLRSLRGVCLYSMGSRVEKEHFVSGRSVKILQAVDGVLGSSIYHRFCERESGSLKRVN
jgi:hypothetical protein